MEVLREKCNPEYQIIMIIDYDDGRLYPLTEDRPKCLLPIANRRMLSYQLALIEKCGGLEVYIVAPKDYETQLIQFLSEQPRRGMTVDLVCVDEMLGSADGLRAVSGRIRGDFIVFVADLLTEFNISSLTDLHRLQTADITMLLADSPLEDGKTKDTRKQMKIDEEDQEYIALSGDGRVVMKIPALEMDTRVTIKKPLFRRCGSSIRIRNDLLDMGIYVCAKWVAEFVKSNTKISNLRTDLIPYLVRRQFQKFDKLVVDIPSIEHRRRPLASIEAWLVRPDTSPLVDMATQFLKQIDTVSDAPSSPCKNVVRNDEDDMDDHLRCFAYVYSRENKQGEDSESICQKMSNIQSYFSLNSTIPVRLCAGIKSIPWTRVEGYRPKEQSTIADATEVGDKVVVKQSSLGKDSKVGANSKLNNCIIMESVTIGEGCTIQNSIICSGVIIESNCNVNECMIGSGSIIKAGSKLKQELLSERSMGDAAN